MDTVKSSLATEKNEAGGMSADTRVVMDKLAAYLANSAVSAGCSDVLMGALSVSMYFSIILRPYSPPPPHTNILPVCAPPAVHPISCAPSPPQASARQQFEYVDSARRGYLRYPDLAIFLKKVRKQL